MILVLLHPTSGYSEIHFYFQIHSEIHASVINEHALNREPVPLTFQRVWWAKVTKGSPILIIIPGLLLRGWGMGNFPGYFYRNPPPKNNKTKRTSWLGSLRYHKGNGRKNIPSSDFAICETLARLS